MKGIKLRKIICLVMVFALSLSSVSSVHANNGNYKPNKKKQYLEESCQISMEGIDLSYNKASKKIKADVSDDVKWYEKKKFKEKAENVTEKLEFFMGRYDETMEEILSETAGNGSDGELVSISYTECPLEMDDEGHLVRISSNEETERDSLIKKAEASSQLMDGKSGKKYYFVLFTRVFRNGKKDSEGRYKYTCKTSGVWSANSFVGGKNFPAAGDDYILQSVPKKFVRQNDSLSINYYTGLKAVNGKHYSRQTGNANYVRYSVVDDPLGTAQMSTVDLITVYKAKPGTGRTVNSHYVHTWKKMTLSVSVEASSSKEVSLSLKPGIADKQWDVYSYATFDF